MKIRIQGNSLRLRLSQAEVEQFGKTGRISERIQFGPAPGEQIAYSLEKSDVQSLEARYFENQITVMVPDAEAKDWVSSDKVGLESSMPIGTDRRLKILVEKDFKCLHRPDEEEKDKFPNPGK